MIPANDDAAKSVECVLTALCTAIQEGLEERKLGKDKEAEAAPAEEAPKAEKTLRSRRAKAASEQKAPASAENAPADDSAAPADSAEPASEPEVESK